MSIKNETLQFFFQRGYSIGNHLSDASEANRTRAGSLIEVDRQAALLLMQAAKHQMAAAESFKELFRYLKSRVNGD